MTKRENFRVKVREFCDTLELFDNIKDELLKSHADLQIILKYVSFCFSNKHYIFILLVFY